MIAGFFHQGSGLGNQLHRMVATRVLAEDKGYKWGMIYNPDGSSKESGFKGYFFTEQPKIIDLAYEDPEVIKNLKEWNEKKVVENGVDIRGYDPEFNFVQDNTVIEGEFQDERYFSHRLDDVREWLKVKPLNVPDNKVIIGFRGGEYTAFPDLFLTKDYWDEAIAIMKAEVFNPVFEVHTDDPETARKFFPDYPIIHDVGMNWRSVRYAKYLIIANSSFFILPALLGNAREIIAPRYWARRNTKTWALPQNYYSRFTYI